MSTLRFISYLLHLIVKQQSNVQPVLSYIHFISLPYLFLVKSLAYFTATNTLSPMLEL